MIADVPRAEGRLIGDVDISPAGLYPVDVAVVPRGAPMSRSPARLRWLTVALTALCALQGTILGTAHHVWCGHVHPAQVGVHGHSPAGCGHSDPCLPADGPHWTGRPTPGSSSSPAHDQHTCLVCRYMAERSLPWFAQRVGNFAERGERPPEAAASFCAASAPSSYHCRAPPV